MSNVQLPERKLPKLIVVVAFDEGEDGELGPIQGYPLEMQSEERATRHAKGLAGKHAGVIAWSREADLNLGEYGPPKELYRHGRVPDME